MKNLLFTFLLLSLYLNTAQAVPINYDFSFDNGTGNVNGTVTGRILGLQDNGAGQAATQVLIDTSPVGLLGTIFDSDVTTWDLGLSNSFNVVNGIITSFIFFAQSSDFDTFILAGAAIGGGAACTNPSCTAPMLSLDNANTAVAGGTLSITAVPEPSILALMGLGLLGFATTRRKIKK